MHGYSRLGIRSNTGASSPPSSPRFRHCRTKSSGGGGFGAGGEGGDGGGRGQQLHSFLERVLFVLVSAVFRRRGLLLLAPLLYISGMLLYMGSLSFDGGRRGGSGGGGAEVQPPGSVYRSPELFEKLWPFMEGDSNRSHNAVLIPLFSIFCSG